MLKVVIIGALECYSLQFSLLSSLVYIFEGKSYSATNINTIFIETVSVLMLNFYFMRVARKFADQI